MVEKGYSSHKKIIRKVFKEKLGARFIEECSETGSGLLKEKSRKGRIKGTPVWFVYAG